jgi:hypothetical protein
VAEYTPLEYADIDSGHEGFWFMGGNLALARTYSRFLALQIKAVELGLIDGKKYESSQANQF